MSRDGFVPLRSIRVGMSAPSAPTRRPQPAAETGRSEVPLSRRRSWASSVAVLQAWSQVVRPPLSGHASPCGFSAGVLSVAVAEAHWRQPLEALAASIREEINHWLGGDYVREVQILVQGREHE